MLDTRQAIVELRIYGLTHKEHSGSDEARARCLLVASPIRFTTGPCRSPFERESNRKKRNAAARYARVPFQVTYNLNKPTKFSHFEYCEDPT